MTDNKIGEIFGIPRSTLADWSARAKLSKPDWRAKLIEFLRAQDEERLVKWMEASRFGDTK